MILHITFKNLFDQTQFKSELASAEYLKSHNILIKSSSSVYCEVYLNGYYTYGVTNVIKDIKSIGLHKQLWSKQKINGHTKSIYY